MHEFIQGGELKRQAKRLLGYRLPIILVIIVNIVLIVRVPMPASRQAQAQSPSTSQWAAFRDRVSAQMAPHAPTSLEDTPSIAPDTEPDRRTPLGVGLTLKEPSDDTATELIPNDVMQQSDAPLPLADDDPMVTETVAEALASLPTIPLATWQQDAEQLVHRWTHSAQNILSAHRAPVLDGNTAATIAPDPAVLQPQLPAKADMVDPATATPAETQPHTDLLLADAGLAVHNPPGNNGTIRFLVNRRLCELQPGESHQFPRSEQWLIQFHPGGEFENVERTVTMGVYQFVVTQHGWDLVRVESDSPKG